jgi:aryl-alcohol dehydrogenase-like predicted oxidoreductase
MYRQGKIRHIGFSELSEVSLRRACKVHPVAALQMEYSPFELSIESSATPLLSTCRELGVALVAYSPLARGFLTGRYKSHDDLEDGDFRKSAPRFSAENFPKNLELLRKFEEVAQRKNVTSGQLCLAWLLAQDDCVFVIPGQVY